MPEFKQEVYNVKVSPNMKLSGERSRSKGIMNIFLIISRVCNLTHKSKPAKFSLERKPGSDIIIHARETEVQKSQIHFPHPPRHRCNSYSFRNE